MKQETGWQWHQLHHTQIISLLKTDDRAGTSSLNFLQPGALPDAQPCQSTAGKTLKG